MFIKETPVCYLKDHTAVTSNKKTYCRFHAKENLPGKGNLGNGEYRLICILLCENFVHIIICI